MSTDCSRIRLARRGPWWINLAYFRRVEDVEKAEAILLRAQSIHPKVAMIAFNLACYASVTGGRVEEAK